MFDNKSVNQLQKKNSEIFLVKILKIFYFFRIALKMLSTVKAASGAHQFRGNISARSGIRNIQPNLLFR